MAHVDDFLGHDGEENFMVPPPPPAVMMGAPPLSTEIPGRVLWQPGSLAGPRFEPVVDADCAAA
eukprot:10011161-Alexandrium_andersonii.AAC.1